jgi:hypothetical protein
VPLYCRSVFAFALPSLAFCFRQFPLLRLKPWAGCLSLSCHAFAGPSCVSTCHREGVRHTQRECSLQQTHSEGGETRQATVALGPPQHASAIGIPYFLGHLLGAVGRSVGRSRWAGRLKASPGRSRLVLSRNTPNGCHQNQLPRLTSQPTSRLSRPPDRPPDKTVLLPFSHGVCCFGPASAPESCLCPCLSFCRYSGRVQI